MPQVSKSAPDALDGDDETAEIKDAERRAALQDAVFRVVQRRIDEEGPTRAGLLPLQWMSPEAVAAEAGVTVEVFEALWEEAETPEGTRLSPFEVFLFATFGVHRSPSVQEHSMEAIEVHTHDLDEMIRAGGGDVTLSGLDWLDFLMSLAVSAYSLHERQDYVVFFDEMDQLYQHLLYRYGRRMKVPLTTRDFAMSVAAVLEGMWQREIYGAPDPNRVVSFKATEQSATKDWTIAGIGVWAIVQGMTEPIE